MTRQGNQGIFLSFCLSPFLFIFLLFELFGISFFSILLFFWDFICVNVLDFWNFCLTVFLSFCLSVLARHSSSLVNLSSSWLVGGRLGAN